MKSYENSYIPLGSQLIAILTSEKVSASSVRTKVSTGYDRLDEALRGGFLVGSAVVLVAPASDEVPVLLRNFLMPARGENLLLSRSLSAAQVVTQESDDLKCLICSEKTVPPSKNVLPGKGIENLTELNFQITEAIDSIQPKRVAMDILSDILLRHKALQTRKWLSELLERLRSKGITALAVLNPYMHSNEEVQAVVDLFDGNLEVFKSDLEGTLTNFLRVKWMHGVEVAEKEFPLIVLVPERQTIGGSDPDRRRIAVLPVANLSAEPADEYFADGLTEELISTMSKIHELSVISRTSAMQYKTKSKPIIAIARELNAGTILEGSVRKAGNRVRISVQMIDAMHDKHLWAENYDRELQDIFAIQSDIAERVAEALRIQLLSAEKKDIGRIATENTEAYILYLKGRHYWNERTREGNDKAVEYFEKAVKLDPKYALAYAGLADCYIIYGDYDWMEPKEAFPKAKEYMSRTIEIDPRLAEPHASLGVLYNSYEGRWQEAEKEFKRAIELKPSYATAHMWYGLLLAFMVRFSEAYDQIKRAGELDPLSRVVGVNLGSVLLYMSKRRDAIEQFKMVIEANRDYAAVHNYLGFAYYLDSRTDEAINELRKALVMSGWDPVMKADLACVLGFAGRHDEANELLEELKELSATTYVSKLKIAQVLFALRRADEAFTYLNTAYEEKSAFTNHGGTLLDLRVWPWFSEARKDPRWAAFEKRLGLRGA